MSGIVKQHVTVEFTNGHVTDSIRIIHADKIALERTARARNWNVEKDFATVNAFLGYAAAKRVDVFIGTYEEFLEQLVDVNVERDENPVDPTQTDH